MPNQNTDTATKSPMGDLLEKQQLNIPNLGELVEGTVISASKNEIYLDINGLTTGVIRGKEIQDESGDSEKIKIGDQIQATVLDIENERGEMELSLRMAGHQKAWDRLEKLMKEEEIIESRVIDANKGGLMASLDHMVGFLPVSQLSPDHYPRVS